MTSLDCQVDIGQEMVMVDVGQVAGQAPFMYVKHRSGHGHALKL